MRPERPASAPRPKARDGPRQCDPHARWRRYRRRIRKSQAICALYPGRDPGRAQWRAAAPRTCPADPRRKAPAGICRARASARPRGGGSSTSSSRGAKFPPRARPALEAFPSFAAWLGAGYRGPGFGPQRGRIRGAEQVRTRGRHPNRTAGGCARKASPTVSAQRRISSTVSTPFAAFNALARDGAIG